MWLHTVNVLGLMGFDTSRGKFHVVYVVVVHLLSHVQLFATSWAAAHQASLSFTVSWNLLKLMSIESMMPSNHLIFCGPPSPPALNLSQHQCLFQ